MLPERSRYYQALIDSNELNRGADYRALKNSNVIFICTFDPFGKGKYRYTFSEICEEDKDLHLCSGTRKIFYNTKAKGDDVPEPVKKLFEYINTGKPVNELTYEIESRIDHARKNSEWGAQYMKEFIVLADAKYEGREEGREATLMDLYHDGILTEAQVCERLKISAEEFKELEKKFETTDAR